MKYIYKGMELELNDKIVKAYEAANEQKIDDSYIDYALLNYVPKTHNIDDITESIHNMIINEIYQFIGADFFKRYNMEVTLKEDGDYLWKDI